MHRDEIRLGNHIVQRSDGHTEVMRTLLIDIRIIGNDIHIERQRALCDTAADTPHADDSQGLPLELDAHILLAIPLALLRGLVRYGDVARHGQHHGHGMLRCSNGIAARRIDYDDALCGCRGNIDIVHAHACAPDNLEFCRLFDDFGRHLGSGAHQKRVELRNYLQKLLCRKLVLYHNVKILLQELNALR